jgi:hypothetical protein
MFGRQSVISPLITLADSLPVSSHITVVATGSRIRVRTPFLTLFPGCLVYIESYPKLGYGSPLVEMPSYGAGPPSGEGDWCRATRCGGGQRPLSMYMRSSPLFAQDHERFLSVVIIPSRKGSI